MKQFAAGFITASVIWVLVLVLESTGSISLFGSSEALEDAGPPVLADEENGSSKESEKKRGRRGKRRRGRARGESAWQEGPGYEKGEGEVGDDLGAPGSREVGMDGPGSEEQLSEREIHRGIDGVFRGIERCLVLVPSDAPTAGKIVVGMHIASTGRVAKVNLKGPNALIKGECGACIQQKVKSIRYPSFDGPDMVAHYPITFE